ncbi:hypothetical protein [Pontibacter cellulosilyticus]|uniref:Uncharacterized protein n=1 Tax=Pontibacter cellulosilyticus TaxID=1720253 RepID=A0A923N506_9BACT|nr:hypothetical protein [Pontibacter cellulosilyticus]MBC5992668.1 hypothetical protein [Pontibacter cellulosilyticus]
MEFFLRQVYPWLIEVSSFSPLLPFIAGLVLFPSNRSKLFKLIFLFLLVTVMSEVAGQITVRMHTKNNLWIQHLYIPLEFSALAAIYYHSFRRVAIKRSILVAVGIILLVSIYDATLGVGIAKVNSMPRMVESSLVIGIVLTYFYKVSNDLSITYLDRDPIFLLSCGLLIHKAGTSMSWGIFNDALAESYDAARMCLAIIFVLNILFNVSLVFVLKRAVNR